MDLDCFSLGIVFEVLGVKGVDLARFCFGVVFGLVGPCW